MNRHALSIALLLSLGAAPAQAQVHVQIEIGLPVLPPLVVIQPGLQVVEGFHEEVFFHKGWYWCRRPNGWYRARSSRARFEWVEPRYVPNMLVQVPSGHYRNWHHDEGHAYGHDKNRGYEKNHGYDKDRGYDQGGRPRELERRDERRDSRRDEHRGERHEERGKERRDDRESNEHRHDR
jgi:hypothetical protein